MATDYSFTNGQVKGRNPWALLGLGLITFGIYLIYWWYAVNREMRDASGGQIDVDPVMSVVAYTIGGIVIVPPFVSFHNTGKRAQEMARIAGRGDGPSLVVWWLLLLFTGIGAHIYLQWEMNKTWQVMQGGPAQPVPVAAPTA